MDFLIDSCLIPNLEPFPSSPRSLRDSRESQDNTEEHKRATKRTIKPRKQDPSPISSPRSMRGEGKWKEQVPSSNRTSPFGVLPLVYHKLTHKKQQKKREKEKKQR